VEELSVDKIHFHPQLMRRFHTVAARLSDRVTKRWKPRQYRAIKPYPQIAEPPIAT